MSDILFYIFAGLIIFFSAIVVIMPNILHSALGLIGSFFATAALYIYFNMELVAITQIMLYVGGIVIFMLIIILLTTSLGEENLFKVSTRVKAWSIALSFTLFMILSHILALGWLPENNTSSMQHTAGSLEAIGYRLLSTDSDGFIIPFEIISIILLTALIGSVIIARKEEHKTEDNK